MQVNRTFAKRDGPEIGRVELTVEKGKWFLDGNELPDASVEYLMTFSLQSLQDAYAGSKSHEEAVGAFEKKRDSVIAGTVGVRTGGGGEEPHMPKVREIMREAMKAGSDKLPEDAQAQFDALKGDSAARATLLEGFFDNLPDEVRENVENAAKERHRIEVEAKQAARAVRVETGL